MAEIKEDIYIDKDRPLYITINSFTSRIIEGDYCFVCAKPFDEDRERTKEHILPKWLLRNFDCLTRTNLPKSPWEMDGQVAILNTLFHAAKNAIA